MDPTDPDPQHWLEAQILCVCVQLAHPHSADRQRDRADEHAVQGEVPQGHPADGGAAQQLHQRS